MPDDTQGTAAAEIAYLRAVAGAIQADESAAAFNLGTVMRRFDRALAALDAGLVLADNWYEIIAGPHERTCAAQLRRVIARELLGEAKAEIPAPEDGDCPESKMDNGYHDIAFYDGGRCSWCGEAATDG